MPLWPSSIHHCKGEYCHGKQWINGKAFNIKQIVRNWAKSEIRRQMPKYVYTINNRIRTTFSFWTITTWLPSSWLHTLELHGIYTISRGYTTRENTGKTTEWCNQYPTTKILTAVNSKVCSVQLKADILPDTSCRQDTPKILTYTESSAFIPERSPRIPMLP